MSVIHPLMVFRCGDNWSFTGPINDANGNPLDLANASITWDLKSLDGKSLYLSLALNSGIDIINMDQATVLYGPTGTQTSNLSPGTYYDALHVSLADGEVYTVIEGLVNALPAI